MFSGHLYFQGIAERPKPRRVCATPASRPSLPAPIEAEEFFRKLLTAAGLPVEAYRSSALNRRASACLRFLKSKDLKSAGWKLELHPELVAPTLGVVLLGVTEFCRDRAVFAQLREIAGGPLAALERPPRVWSAACSDGQELYSVAMVLSDAGLLDGAELLGTDCRMEAIRRAEAGEFSPEASSKLDEAWRGMHFAASGRGWRASERLGRAMRWKRADLLRAVEPGPWDLVLWRNMAIYLEAAAAERVWLSIFSEMAPGGFLVTGKADHPPKIPGLEKAGACLYRKTGP